MNHHNTQFVAESGANHSIGGGGHGSGGADSGVRQTTDLSTSIVTTTSDGDLQEDPNQVPKNCMKACALQGKNIFVCMRECL